jgi:hypothetical protein
MADSTITLQGVVLRDNWPGVPITPPVAYSDMAAASVGHSLANPMWRLGQKWKVYCNGDGISGTTGYNLGWSTFIYLQCESTITSPVAAVATSIVVINGTIAAANAATKHLIVTSDTDRTTHENAGFMAVALSTMVNSYYAWFWCGGVAPIQYVPLFTTASTLITDDSVVANCELGTVAAATTAVALRANPTGSQVAGVGYALYADGQ